MTSPSRKCETLSLVVPVYNESGNISRFIQRVDESLSGEDAPQWEIIFVNDGSQDDTLEVLLKACSSDKRIAVVDLSRNFGKEAALTAGLDRSRGQAIVPIDVDLQHPPEIINEMISLWELGYEVVLARRRGRDGDAMLQRGLASAFYRVHNLLAEPKIPANVGDFRLMDRVVVEALKQLPESRRFMKGIFAWAGFKTAQVDFDCPNRIGGKSRFSTASLWNFALEGLTSFSTSLLRAWTYLGFAVAFVAFLYAAWITVRTMFFGIDVPGYASLAVMMMFLGGVQLVGIGIIGEYLGRTYVEAKRRPVYLVRGLYGFNDIGTS